MAFDSARDAAENDKPSFGLLRELTAGRLLVALLMFATWIACAWLIAAAHQRTEVANAVAAARADAARQAQATALDIRGLFLEKTRVARAIAYAPEVRNLLISRCKDDEPSHRPLGTTRQARIDRYLTGIAESLDATSLYIGDRNGIGIAAAFEDPARGPSLVGVDYSDRAYFQQARGGMSAVQYAVGKATGVGGFHFAAPILDEQSFCGYVVFKVSSAALAPWIYQSGAILTDANGLVIAASDDSLEMKAIAGTKVFDLAPEHLTQLYGRREFQTVSVVPLKDEFEGAVRIDEADAPLALIQRAIPEYGLTLLETQPVLNLSDIARQRLVLFVLLTVIGLLLIVLLTASHMYLKASAKSRASLRHTAERLKAAASAGIVGVWEWDVAANRFYWDEVMFQLYGLRKSDFDGAFDAWACAVHPDDKERAEAEIRGALRADGELMSEFRTVWPDGSVHYLKAMARTSCDANGKPIRMVGVNYDLTEQKKIQHDLDKLAFHDRLTELPNRRLLEDRLFQEVAKARRTHTKLCLLFIDLDEFKPINDTHGHAVGDWLLKRVAERMQSCVRASDTVARIGGDEFIILLPECGKLGHAMAVAEKVRHAVGAPCVTDDGLSLQVSSSIGLVLYPDHAVAPQDLLRQGDEAMYRAKKAGRNAVEVFAPHFDRVLHQNWQAEYESGEPAIDRDHKNLLLLVNRFIDAIQGEERDEEASLRVLEELVTCLERHFADEEEILRKLRYEDLPAHIEGHAAMLAKARATLAGARTEGLAVQAVIDFLLGDIVTRHIMEEDRRSFPLFASHKRHPAFHDL